jgi:hypothetical protein
MRVSAELIRHTPLWRERDELLRAVLWSKDAKALLDQLSA